MKQSDFNDLVERAKAGDQDAIAEIVREYEDDVRMVARINLGDALRPHIDSIDLVQSVHRSLLVGLRDDKFDISTPGALVALATTMVRRKISRKWRKIQREKRRGGPADEPKLPELVGAFSTDDATSHAKIEVMDELEILFAKMDETEQQLVTLRFQGFSTAEVARMLNLDPNVLRVRLSRLRQRIESSGLLADWL